MPRATSVRSAVSSSSGWAAITSSRLWVESRASARSTAATPPVEGGSSGETCARRAGATGRRRARRRKSRRARFAVMTAGESSRAGLGAMKGFPMLCHHIGEPYALLRRGGTTSMIRAVRFILPGLLTLALPLQAAVFTVTKTADTFDGACDRDCSLREAIAAANVEPLGGADVVVVPAGIYVLTRTGAGEEVNATGDLDVYGGTILVGAG